jgi:hypothetical protein
MMVEGFGQLEANYLCNLFASASPCCVIVAHTHVLGARLTEFLLSRPINASATPQGAA